MQLSLIIPVYNLAGFLNETVAAVAVARKALGADAADTEIVFVDDGSTDGSGPMLDALAGRDGVRILHQANGGPGAARNSGIEVARGAYIFFLDGDDVLLPNALTEAFGLMRAYPRADVIGFRFAPFASGGGIPEPAGARMVRELDLRTELPSELIARLGIFPTLFARELVRKVRFGDLPLGEDRLFVLQCLAHAGSAVVSDAVVEAYRVREGSLARATWSSGKILSLNDHAAEGLAVLARSGKAIGRSGAGYLASLVVSEVPARIARLGRADGVRDAWRHWIGSVRALPAGFLPFGVRFARQLILAFAFSQRMSVGVARVCRALGLA